VLLVHTRIEVATQEDVARLGRIKLDIRRQLLHGGGDQLSRGASMREIHRCSIDVFRRCPPAYAAPGRGEARIQPSVRRLTAWTIEREGGSHSRAHQKAMATGRVPAGEHNGRDAIESVASVCGERIVPGGPRFLHS
jgi:hypothetical protein